MTRLPKVDFIVESPEYTIQLAAEAKALRNLTSGDAAQLRRNLLAHGTAPPANFFLLLSPEHFYLWKDGKTVDVLPPDYTIEAPPILQRKTGEVPVARLTSISFEMVAFSWLDEVIHCPTKDQAAEIAGTWIVESGLYDAIRNGVLKTEYTT
jgi:hypothetical protein